MSFENSCNAPKTLLLLLLFILKLYFKINKLLVCKNDKRFRS